MGGGEDITGFDFSDGNRVSVSEKTQLRQSQATQAND